jgi:hypothetical protein
MFKPCQPVRRSLVFTTVVLFLGLATMAAPPALGVIRVVSPGQSITSAINASVAGDIIRIRGGTYREEVAVNVGGTSDLNRLIIENYPGETPVLKGSAVVPAGEWVWHSGNIWRTRNPWNRSNNVTIQIQQVFDNGLPLRQVGQPVNYGVAPGGVIEYLNPLGGPNGGVAQMIAGSFYHEMSSGYIYVWLNGNANPNTSGRLMEASVRVVRR